MASIQSLPNSVWPNGLQTDSEGYVNFYPLGTNKVDISAITWPEGNKVRSSFVYQDDKLVGFIDTKALEIDNNDTTIDINYTYFDADLDSIMENTLTINAPANAVVNVKYGAVDKVLTEKIEKILGKGKCKITFDKNTNKVTINVALETTAEQINEVNVSLQRLLPNGIESEIKWIEGYTPLEYIQHQPISSTIDNYGTQYIVSDIAVDNNTATEVVYTPFVLFQGRTCHLLGAAPLSNTDINGGASWENLPSYVHSLTLSNQESWLNWGRESDTVYAATGKKGVTIGQKSKVLFEKGKVTIDGTSVLYDAGNITPNTRRIAIGASRPRYSSETQLHEVLIWKNGGLEAHFIPALHEATGAPCMYDIVSGEPYWNVGTRDFLYPGAEQIVQTTDLDNKSYAKITKHGIHRLYRVPKGYTLTMDEYAAANGFKELVEPPAPLEGYWAPQWRETETQLILDWVETKPPIEEVETLNNEN